MTPARVAALIGAAALFVQSAAWAQTGSDASLPVENGRNIYELGLGSAPIAVRFGKGPWKSAGSRQACRACHGDSAEGGSEGGVTAPTLTAHQLDRPALAAWLSRAVNEHRASDGKPLSDAMPRYRMDKTDVAALAAYLEALPSIPASGVSATEIRVLVDPTGSPLSQAGRAVLDEELSGLSRNFSRTGGLFGRTVTYVVAQPGEQPSSAVVDIVWRSVDARSSRPALSVRAGTVSADGCGSLDPALPVHAAAIEDWIRTNRRPWGESTVILEGDTAQVGRAVLSGTVPVVAAEVAARLLPGDRSQTMAILSPGDLARRTAEARALMNRHAIGAEEALAIAVYLEAAGLVQDTVQGVGRRVRRMALCDALRSSARTRQVATLVSGSQTDVIALP